MAEVLMKCGACGRGYPDNQVRVDDQHDVRIKVRDVSGRVISQQTAWLDLVVCDDCDDTGSFEVLDGPELLWVRDGEAASKAAVIRMGTRLGLDVKVLKEVIGKG